MDLSADRLELLDHEPPPGCRLQRNLELLAAETASEPAHTGAICRSDPPPRHLARPGIQPIRGDLRSVLVESHYDRHAGPPQAPRSKTPARTSAALELRRSLHLRQDRPRPAHAIYVKKPMAGKLLVGVGRSAGVGARCVVRGGA